MTGRSVGELRVAIAAVGLCGGWRGPPQVSGDLCRQRQAHYAVCLASPVSQDTHDGAVPSSGWGECSLDGR